MGTCNPLDTPPRNAVGCQTGARTWDPLTEDPGKCRPVSADGLGSGDLVSGEGRRGAAQGLRTALG